MKKSNNLVQNELFQEKPQTQKELLEQKPMHCDCIKNLILELHEEGYRDVHFTGVNRETTMSGGECWSFKVFLNADCTETDEDTGEDKRWCRPFRFYIDYCPFCGTRIRNEGEGVIK